VDGRNLHREGLDMGPIVFLLIGIAAFVGVVVWVFARRRKARFDEDARIPLDDGKR
jgi:cytochrome c oxidase cbb3-type subunit 4